MRPARQFSILRRAAERRLTRLRNRTKSALTQGVSDSERDRVVAYVVLEAQNLWSNFVRSYVLSLLGKPRRVLGGRVTIVNLTLTSPGSVLHLAAKATRGPLALAPVTRREEPAWHDVNTLLKTCTQIGPSNQSNIIAAMSLQTRVFADLPTFRNFYAHRNEESARKALDIARRQYLIMKTNHPTEALGKPAIRRPQALLLDWLDEMQSVIELLCD